MKGVVMTKFVRFAAACVAVSCSFSANAVEQVVPGTGDDAAAINAAIAGTCREWMNGATDLNGNPRILNKVVDIGCYEVPVTGLMLIVR